MVKVTVKESRKVKVRVKARVKVKERKAKRAANGVRKENGDARTAAGVNEYAGGWSAESCGLRKITFNLVEYGSTLSADLF